MRRILRMLNGQRNLTESGEYYIVIEHAKNVDEPGFYRFEISGDGVAY